MSIRENRLWQWLAGAKKVLRRHLHMSRVENAVMAGMPDVEGHLEGGGQFWIELKVAERPAREETAIAVKFQPSQVPWLERRASVGGRCFVLLQVGSGAEARRYLVHGGSARVIEDGATEALIASMSETDPRAEAAEIVSAAALG